MPRVSKKKVEPAQHEEAQEVQAEAQDDAKDMQEMHEEEPEPAEAGEEAGASCACEAKPKKKARYRSATDEPAKPKRPPNAFMLYSKEQRTQFDKTMKVTEVAKEIGAKWRELSEEEKNRYKQMALDLKAAS